MRIRAGNRGEAIGHAVGNASALGTLERCNVFRGSGEELLFQMHELLTVATRGALLPPCQGEEHQRAPAGDDGERRRQHERRRSIGAGHEEREHAAQRLIGCDAHLLKFLGEHVGNARAAHARQHLPSCAHQRAIEPLAQRERAQCLHARRGVCFCHLEQCAKPDDGDVDGEERDELRGQVVDRAAPCRRRMRNAASDARAVQQRHEKQDANTFGGRERHDQQDRERHGARRNVEERDGCPHSRASPCVRHRRHRERRIRHSREYRPVHGG